MKGSFLKFRLIPFYVFFLLLTVLVSRNGFFWDTIQLGARHALFYYDNHLNLSFLPDAIDSGHIPAFGYVLALIWTLFGKSLIVSHFFILPFLLGIVYQTDKILKRYFSPEYRPLAFIIFLIDPTLLGQATLVSPDIPLLFFFLLLLNSVYDQKKILKLLAVIGLALVSMRGWMVAVIGFIFEGWLLYQTIGIKKTFQKIGNYFLCYLPGGIIAIAYLIAHYSTKGWIGYHENSPWAECFLPVSTTGFFRNILIYGWRLVDFGRIGLWIVFILYLRSFIRSVKMDSKMQELTFLCGLFLIFYPFTMLLHQNLLGHRYLLPVFLSFAILVGYLLLEKSESRKMIKILVSFSMITLLMAGNLLVYPDKIAQGWDSSMAYLPYMKLRKSAMHYMEQNNIPFAETGTEFPNKAEFKYIDLTEDSSRFAMNDLENNNYFLYSNVFNDITDKEYDILHNEWIAVKKYSSGRIKMTLFKNPE